MKKYTDKQFEAIKNELYDNELKAIVQELQDIENGAYDDLDFINMADFEEEVNLTDDIIRLIGNLDKSFSPYDDYYIIDGLGYYQSFKEEEIYHLMYDRIDEIIENALQYRYDTMFIDIFDRVMYELGIDEEC